MPNDGGFNGLPQWYAPPEMIGGHVSGPVLIGRSPGVVVAVRQVLAYPVGVEIVVDAHARRPAPAGDPADPAFLFADHHELRFSLRFADGAHVTLDDEAGLRSGRGPMLTVCTAESSSGGPDDAEDVRMTLWTWPLPPPGPLTLTCSWPRRGLQDAGLVLDADAIRAAAGDAEPLWPETA